MTSCAIHDRWARADDFYAERDNRTRLEVRDLFAYVLQPVEIHVSPELADDPAVQQIALLAANLTARWARRIRVFVPRVTVTAWPAVRSETTLACLMAEQMRAADPFGEWEFAAVGAPSSSPLRLFIGDAAGASQGLRADDYLVDASGWSAVGCRGSVGAGARQPATAAASALAAAVGAADLFKRAIGHDRAHWLGDFQWCTWGHSLAEPGGESRAPAAPSCVDVGKLLIAGVGAIGSALLYILGSGPLTGRLTLLDRDAVDTSNLNRSPLFTVADALESRKKTEVGKAFLDGLGISNEVVDGTWRQHGEQLSRRSFDAWVSLTNEDSAWAEVPFQLPPVVLHGTTTSGWGITFGRHIPVVEDCTACRLPRPTAEFRGPCAEGEVPAAGAETSLRASLPFLSTASAALIAAELTKLQYQEVRHLPNCVSADFRFGLPAVLALSIRATSTCRGCQMSRLPLWAERGGRGRFAALSRVSQSSERA